MTIIPTLGALRPGDIMFGPIGGLVPGAFPVGVGQILLANRRARLSWRKWWRIRHVGVVVQTPRVDAWGHVAGGPRLVQAMPHGAEEIELTPATHWTRDYVYLRPECPRNATPSRPYGWTVGEHIAAAARGYVGTPYNFLTYAKLAAGVLRMPATEKLLKRWISTRHDMMCSQLVDQCLADAGFHVFDDGRLPQDVVPAELFLQLMTLPGRHIVPGGQGWIDNSLRYKD